MKKILITGANSYIGTSFEKYIKENYPNDYVVDTVDMIGDDWKSKSFEGYDVVFHVAGIAHSDSGKISKEKEKLYRSVNTDLAVETAKKAKNEGVRQFIYMSSMIVFGSSSPIGKSKIITKDTKPCPENCYGDSKLQAELGILPLSSEEFKVVVVRPPMIYGKGCKGNFPSLVKFSNLPFFPYVKNQRSMLYLGNLLEFIRLVILRERSGIYHPQNVEYSNTSILVRDIAYERGKKTVLVRGVTWILIIMSLFIKKINKAFGSFAYEKEMSKFDFEYVRYSLSESLKEIEENK